MKIERVIVGLLALTLAMQGFTLYKQFKKPPSPPNRPPVYDALEGTFLDTSGLPMVGNTDAKVVLVEFADYECPFCARHASGVAKDISKAFVMTGKIRQAFVNNPLDIHPNAVALAEAAICAGAQGHYWEMHSALFDRKPKTVADALTLAKSEIPAVNTEALEDCLNAPDTHKVITRDRAIAKRFDLTGTPAFAIGIESNGRLRILKFIGGAQPFSVFQYEINKVINTPA